jgi:hypothetical protein
MFNSRMCDWGTVTMVTSSEQFLLRFIDLIINSSSSRHETMVDDVLTRTWVLSVVLGVSGTTIMSGSCVRPSHSWISHLLTSSLSLGISSLFCRGTQCM